MSPVEPKAIHFVGIGGVGMGTLAAELAAQGIQVSGSDAALYEPMKGVLEKAQVKLFEGYDATRCQQVKPDVVIIGNVIRKENPESRAWIRSGIPFWSFPEAVRRLVIGNKTSIVCAGTHGKTTTTSWTAFLLREVGLDPSYLIGGVPVDLPSGCAITPSNVFVGEGDEYDSAFFDKGPKFLHYNPHCLILANIEFDHADIYRDLAHIESAFAKGVALLPGHGLCVVRHEDPVARRVAEGAHCEVQTFGLDPQVTWSVGQVEHRPEGMEFELSREGKSQGVFRTQLFGEHNILNIVSGMVAAVHCGVDIQSMREVVGRFQGVRRRQQILLTQPITLVDDFAHHPTEVAATLHAVRSRFKTGTLWAFFEPRSATARRGAHQASYPAAFEAADRVLIAEPYRASELPPGARFETDLLVDQLTHQGKIAQALSSVDEMVRVFKEGFQPGDTAVVMSNGEFGRIQTKLRKLFDAPQQD